MKIWESNPQTKKLQEAKVSLSGKTVLVLPGTETTDDNLLFVNGYMNSVNGLLKNNGDIKIYCASWEPEPESGSKKLTDKQYISPAHIGEIIEHNKEPYKHVNAMQGLVDEVFLPLLKDKNRWGELDNLTIFANSYGTMGLVQLENGVRKALSDLNYSKEDQKKLMNKVCAVGVIPVINIGKEDISFKKTFIAPSNDRMNAGVNLNAGHLSGNIDRKPSYEKIGDHGLLVSAPAVPVKKIGRKLAGPPFAGSPVNINSGHNIISLLTQGDDLYSSANPDLFPALIRTALCNSVGREGVVRDLTAMLKPAGKPDGFCERIQKELLDEFVEMGEIKADKKIFVANKHIPKEIVLPKQNIILKSAAPDAGIATKGLSL